jgi:tetratricopeptide (TPR) repeat protein
MSEQPRLSLATGALGALVLLLLVVALLLGAFAHNQRKRLLAAEVAARDSKEAQEKEAEKLAELQARYVRERRSGEGEVQALSKELEAAQDEALGLRQSLRKVKAELEQAKSELPSQVEGGQAAFERGSRCMREQSWREAYHAFSAALEAGYQPAYSHYYRGISRQRLGDSDGALEDFDAALEREPSLYKVRYNRGSLRMHSSDVKGALADADAMLKVDPTYGAAYYLRGVALAGLQRRPEAVSVLKEALRRMERTDPLRSAVLGALRSLTSER